MDSHKPPFKLSEKVVGADGTITIKHYDPKTGAILRTIEVPGQIEAPRRPQPTRVVLTTKSRKARSTGRKAAHPAVATPASLLLRDKPLSSALATSTTPLELSRPGFFPAEPTPRTNPGQTGAPQQRTYYPPLIPHLDPALQLLIRAEATQAQYHVVDANLGDQSNPAAIVSRGLNLSPYASRAPGGSAPRFGLSENPYKNINPADYPSRAVAGPAYNVNHNNPGSGPASSLYNCPGPTHSNSISGLSSSYHVTPLVGQVYSNWSYPATNARRSPDIGKLNVNPDAAPKSNHNSETSGDIKPEFSANPPLAAPHYIVDPTRASRPKNAQGRTPLPNSPIRPRQPRWSQENERAITEASRTSQTKSVSCSAWPNQRS